MSSRFDYLPFDHVARCEHGAIRSAVELTEMALMRLGGGTARARALQKLEEVYMWAGKAIRDDQTIRHHDSERKSTNSGECAQSPSEQVVRRGT